MPCQPWLPAPALGTRAKADSLKLRPPSLFPIHFAPCCFPPPLLEPGWALHEAQGCWLWVRGCWCRAQGSLGWWGAAWSQRRAPAATLPIIPQPAGAPPGGERSFKEDLEMSNGKHLTGEPLRRFCSSEWECEIRSDMKGCAAPSPKSRRRGGRGVCGCTGRSSRERLALGSPLPPSLPFQQLN